MKPNEIKFFIKLFVLNILIICPFIEILKQTIIESENALLLIGGILSIVLSSFYTIKKYQYSQ